MDAQAASIPAPYGKACEACSKSKCRCLFRPGGDVCDRCHRLGRECRPGQLKRSRKGSEVTTRKISRIEEAVGKTVELERRFDQLVARLQNQGNCEVTFSTPGHSKASTETISQNGTAAEQETQSETLTARIIMTPETSSLHQGDLDIEASSKVSSEVAELHLRTFRNDFLPWLPFVYLDPELTACQLYQDRPTFWLSIMLTCTRVAKDKRHLDNTLRMVFATEMVVKSRKSIDLLLATVTYLTWYHHHCRFDDGSLRLSLSLISHLAISLVSDLKRPAIMQPQHYLRVQLCRNQSMDNAADHLRSLEEIRAYLACYLVTSTTCSALHKIDSLRWDKYLNDCLQELEGKSKLRGDEILTRQVRIRLVSDKLSAFKQWETAWEPNEASHTPMGLCISTLQSEIHRLKSSLSYEPKDNNLLQLHALHAELTLSELGLTKPQMDKPLNLEQLRLRFACLASAKAWTDAFLAGSAADMHTQAITISMQMSNCCTILFHLSTSNDLGWDRQGIDHLDTLKTLDALIDHMAEAAKTLELGDDDTVASQCQLHRHMRSIWLSKLQEGQSKPTDVGLDAGGGGDGGEGLDLPPLSDAALHDLFNAGLWDHEWMSTWPTSTTL